MELDAIPQTPNLEAEGIAQVHPSHGVVVSGGSIKEESHRISFCYGLLVFFGLCLSLLTLTLLVVYVGVWSQHTLYGNDENGMKKATFSNKTFFVQAYKWDCIKTHSNCNKRRKSF